MAGIQLGLGLDYGLALDGLRLSISRPLRSVSSRVAASFNIKREVRRELVIDQCWAIMEARLRLRRGVSAHAEAYCAQAMMLGQLARALGDLDYSAELAGACGRILPRRSHTIEDSICRARGNDRHR